MDKGRWGRKDRLIRERRHDTYEEWGKRPDGTVCTRCGAVYEGGRWTWSGSTRQTGQAMCPACQRIQDDYPAGILSLGGDFFRQHRKEIMNLIRNIEEQEKGPHPMERIISVKEREEGGAMVTTTGVHVARRIGEALQRSYQGEYSLKYEDGEKSVRINWQR
ncbi:MAG: ATPase [bacterium]|nr:MAG: ATPase [bacterium]